MYFDCMDPQELDELYEAEERADRQKHDDKLHELWEESRREEREEQGGGMTEKELEYLANDYEEGICYCDLLDTLFYEGGFMDYGGLSNYLTPYIVESYKAGANMVLERHEEQEEDE